MNTRLIFTSVCTGIFYTVACCAEETIDSAWKQVEFLNLKQALVLFRKAEKEDGLEPGEQVSMRFGKALCLHQIQPAKRGTLEKAYNIYSEIIRDFPRSRCAPRCLYNMGRIAQLRDFHGDVPDFELARRLYQRILKEYPHKEIIHEAALRLAESHIETFETENVCKGAAMLKDWLEKHPANLYANIMWQYLGDVYCQPLEQMRDALDAYINADRIGVAESAKEGYLYWKIANIALYRLNDRQTAIKYFTRIVKEMPVFIKTWQARQELKKLGADVPERNISSEGLKARKVR